MLFVIVAISWITTTCTAETMSHLQQGSSNEAISSQSFNREDVPLSYKYSAIHIYTTPKPELVNHQPHVNNYQHQASNVANYQNIQYAPLPTKVEEQTSQENSGLHTKINVPEKYDYNSNNDNNAYSTTSTIRTDHLEPRHIATNNKNLHYNSFIPGHNIMLQSVNRHPGHNALYRSYNPYTAQKNNKDQINYLNQYVEYKKAEPQIETVSHKPQDTKNNETPESMKTTSTIYALVPQLYYKPQSNRLNQARPESLLPVYSKMPRLHLNTARAYNFAHMASNGYIKYEKPPTHTQAFVRAPGSSQLTDAASVQITHLYPIKDHQYRSRF